MRTTTTLAAALLAAMIGHAHAQPAEPPSGGDAGEPPAAAPADDDADAADAEAADAEDADADAGGGGHGKKKKHEPHDDAAAGEKPPADPDADVSANDSDSPWDNLELSGRVYFRAEGYHEDGNDWLAQLSLPSARLGVKYKWKDRLAAKVSFEVRGSVRDAYLDVALSPCLTLRAGRFKLPASAIERTSTWTLPSIDRPLGSDVLGGGLGVVGRNIGAGLIWDPGTGVKPKVELMISQPFDIAGLPTAAGPRLLSEYGGVGVTLRGELEPVKDVVVGAFAQTRTVNDGHGPIDRYWTGGVDLEAERGGLRVWADAIGGTSQFGVTDDPTPFVVAQAVAGWRHGGRKPGKRYVEPFVAGAYVNPDAHRKSNEVVQVAGGVAAGRWKRYRGQLQLAQRSNTGDQPTADLGGIDATFYDRLTVTAQLSAAF